MFDRLRRSPSLGSFFFVAVTASGFVGCGSSEVAPKPNEGEIAAAKLTLSFPEQAARVLEEGDELVRSERGFVRTPNVFAPGAAVHAELPRDGSIPIVLRSQGFELRVKQVGVESEGALAKRAVAYRRAGGTSYWTVGTEGAEEWLELSADHVRSDAPVASWEIEGGVLRQHEELIEILDANGTARMRVTAPVAYAKGNREIGTRLEAEGTRLALYVDANGEDVLVDPVWSDAANMAQARVQHTMTLLKNGKVLVAGGKNTALDSSVLGTAEIYDPTTNTWTLTASGLTARRAHTATLMANGTVLVVGGFQATAGTAAHASAQIYDPVANIWSAAASVGARGAHGAVWLSDNRVMVAGGFSGTAGTSVRLTTVQTYDPISNAWSSMGTSLAAARQFPTMTQVGDGTVVIAGGDTSSSPPTATVDRYLGSSRLASTASMNGGRSGHSAVLLSNGKILVTNGATAGTSSAFGEVFTPPNTWTKTGNMVATRTNAAAVLLDDDKVLVIGGGSGTTALNTAEIYDPVTNNWTAYDVNMKTARRGLTAVKLQDGRVLVAGGEGSLGVPLSSAEILEVASKKALGETCSNAGECTSGFCADGVCCDTACSAGACDACIAAGGADTDGTCKLLTGNACDDGNACTGVDTCQAGVCTGGAPETCSGQGTCNSATGVCGCSAGYAGDKCQYSDAVTCNGHGTAQANGSCACASGFAGDKCQYSDAVTCNGHGAAQTNGSCSCASGFTGPSCNGCAPGHYGYPSCVACDAAVDCSGHGTCNAVGGCDCAAGFAGDKCHFSDAVTCNGHGTAKANGSCACDSGFAGASCDGCAAGHFGYPSCQPQAGQGAACAGNIECANGRCVDGFCCDTSCVGQCEACNVTGSEGVCSAVTGAPRNGRPSCADDGNGCGGSCNGTKRDGCAYPTTSCRAASCDSATNVATVAANCDGQGSCPAKQTVTCAPYLCDGTACAGDCVDDGACGTSAFCAANVCVGKLAKGTSCAGDNQCDSGHCVDGVCCESACEGQCQACGESGSEGSCVAVTGAPRSGRDACAGTGDCAGSCNGVDIDACAFPGASTSCGASSCSNGTAIGASFCDGEGACQAGASEDCGAYGCDSEGCKTSCALEDDCADGYVCVGSACVVEEDGGAETDAGADAGEVEDSGTGEDAGEDVDAGETDASVDAGEDAEPADSGSDVEDAGADGSDGEDDAGLSDAGADAPGDAATDSGSDAGSDGPGDELDETLESDVANAGGCGCRTAGVETSPISWWWGALPVAAAFARRRRAAR